MMNIVRRGELTGIQPRGCRVCKWQILLQKYFGACPRDREQKSIPAMASFRTKIPGGSIDAG
jgi:hypothetical protein